MSREKEIKNYCIYCKNAIYEGDAYTTGTDGRIYHPDCYVLEHTDDFGGTSDEREYDA